MDGGFLLSLFLSLSGGRVLAISHELFCIRLSSLLCCELASHVRVARLSLREALSLPPPSPPPARRPSVTSEAADQEGESFLSIHLPVFRAPRAPPPPISNLPLLGERSVHPVFATLPAFLHTITRGCAYAFRA